MRRFSDGCSQMKLGERTKLLANSRKDNKRYQKMEDSRFFIAT